MSVLNALVALSMFAISMGSMVVASAEAPPMETKDRLSPDELEQLVALPMAAIQEDGLQAGKQAFDKLLTATKERHGDNSVEVADLLTAFGVQLYTAGSIDEDVRLKRSSLEYLKAAVPIYRSVFGAEHPEVAVALHSYANAELGVHKDEPPQSAARALEEVYRIRSKTFGLSNAETRAIRLELAALEGHPSHVKRDPSSIQRSAQLFEELIKESPLDPAARDTSAPGIRLALARMYAKNGLVREAMQNVEGAEQQMQSWPQEQRCVAIQSALLQLQTDLRDYGHGPEAESLASRTGLTQLLNCVG